ncbi:MAG: hypothetical protein BWY96_02543 [Spirochaetes bacterium ADurb.BinA120]|nr:MAG: hypothetical protein BWY96_02543 [Spirochaetes bacterium ADurb.BinA120]
MRSLTPNTYGSEVMFMSFHTAAASVDGRLRYVYDLVSEAKATRRFDIRSLGCQV